MPHRWCYRLQAQFYCRHFCHISHSMWYFSFYSILLFCIFGMFQACNHVVHSCHIIFIWMFKNFFKCMRAFQWHWKKIFIYEDIESLLLIYVNADGKELYVFYPWNNDLWINLSWNILELKINVSSLLFFVSFH